MQKHLHNLFLGVSVLPALLVMPALADKTEIIERQVFLQDATLNNSNVHGISNTEVGGAILSSNKLVITNSDITGNTSGAAAALYDNSLTAFKDQSGNYSVTIDNSKISDNSAGDFGAVAIFSPGSKVSNSEFTDNTATADYANLGDGAGALFLGSESQTLVSKTSFSGNSSGTIGGAIATRPINYWLDTNYSGKGTNSSAGAKVDIISSQFSNNVAGTRGGAFFNSFYNSDSKEGYAFVKDSTFSDNSAELGGGVFVEGWTDADGGNAKLWVEGSTFTGNTATKAGAIYNESILYLADSTFSENSAVNSGGAIENKDTAAQLTLKNVNFDENTADWGGALLVRGTATITDGTFSGNTSNDGGGAIYLATLENKGHKLNINGTTFTNNGTIGTDVDGGGAIGSFSDLVLRNATFTGNYFGVENIDTVADGGGAIFMGSVSTNLIENTTFTNNTSKLWGGAISMRDTNKGNNEDATLDMNKVTFTNNSAVNGGAIYNTFHNNAHDDGYISVTNATFDKNNAAKGGAFYNAAFGIKDSVGGVAQLNNVSFTNNIATANGGAIYNENTLFLAGTNQFAGNKANNVANDIHNIGAVEIVSGTTTLDGGITGDGTLTIDNGATLNIGKASITQDTIDLNGTLIAQLVSDADSIFNASIFESSENTGKLNLAIEKEGTYNLFGNAVFADAQTQVTSAVYDLDWGTNEGKTVVATKKSVEKIVEDTGLKTESAATVSRIADVAAIEEAPKQLKDLSVKLQEKLALGDTDAVEHATKAVNPEKESVAQSVSTSVQNTVVNLASARMASPSVGRNGGDVEFTSGGVWAQGLVNKSKQGSAFSGNSRGIAVGMDGTINKDWTIGAGYSFAHSDISGTARDTDIDSNTIFLYGQYKPAEWYLNAIANYTMSDYSERGTILDGIAVTGDYRVNSFGGALAAGYDFDNGVTPELGLRYMHVKANDYANSYGINTHMDDTNFLTGVIGARYAFDVAAADHITFAPQLSAAMKYDMVSDKNVATVTMPGLNAYTLEGGRLNRFGGEFGIGLGMKYYEFDLSINYSIDVREDYNSQTGMLKFRYNF